MELFLKLKSIVAHIEEDFDMEDKGTATEVNSRRIEQGMKLIDRLLDTIRMDRALKEIQ